MGGSKAGVSMRQFRPAGLPSEKVEPFHVGILSFCSGFAHGVRISIYGLYEESVNSSSIM